MNTIEYNHISEHDFGWVFYYDSLKHLQTRDFRHELLGNAPLIVNKHTDELIEMGTARFYAASTKLKNMNCKQINLKVSDLPRYSLVK